MKPSASRSPKLDRAKLTHEDEVHGLPADAAVGADLIVGNRVHAVFRYGHALNQCRKFPLAYELGRHRRLVELGGPRPIVLPDREVSRRYGRHNPRVWAGLRARAYLLSFDITGGRYDRPSPPGAAGVEEPEPA